MQAVNCCVSFIIAAERSVESLGSTGCSIFCDFLSQGFRFGLWQLELTSNITKASQASIPSCEIITLYVPFRFYVLFKVSKRNRSKLQHYLWRWPPDLENWSQ